MGEYLNTVASDYRMSANPPSGSPSIMAGRYRVERLIARGGMGSVYLAHHLDLNRKVALKVLSPSPEHEEGGSFEERFRLEAETLASLNHQNIVTIYDYGRAEDGRFYLALEYIDGPRFTDILRAGTLPVDRAVRLILQVAKALRYAHKRGVVHRDLKPSNLMIKVDDDGEEHVKVVDFGLVKVLEDDQSLTRAGLILGSPHCMAPEQIKGEDIDHRADIYALGVLLFRSITGRWPFHGESGTATMIAHINNPVPAFAEVAPEVTVSDGFEEVVRRCLAKSRNDRYADVATLMVDLRRVAGLAPAASTIGGSISGSITPTLPEPETEAEPEPAPARPAPRRNFEWLRLALVAVLLFLVGVVVISGVVAITVFRSGSVERPGQVAGPSTEAPSEPAGQVLAGETTAPLEQEGIDQSASGETAEDEAPLPAETVTEVTHSAPTPEGASRTTGKGRDAGKARPTKTEGGQSTGSQAGEAAPPEGYMPLPPEF